MDEYKPKVFLNIFHEMNNKKLKVFSNSNSRNKIKLSKNIKSTGNKLPEHILEDWNWRIFFCCGRNFRLLTGEF